MIQKPKLKTFLTVFPLSDTTWGLRGGSEEMWRIKLPDERAILTFSSLLPYLNGQSPVEEILDTLDKKGIDRGLTQKLLQRLESSSLIEEADSAGLLPEEEEQYSDQIALFGRFTDGGGAKYQAILRDSRIAVVGDGNLSRSVQRHLGISGFGKVTIIDDQTAPFHLEANGNGNAAANTHAAPEAAARQPISLWPEDRMEHLPHAFIIPQEAHNPLLLEAMDKFSKQHNVPWMLLRTTDPKEGWVGPLFVPGDTASYLSFEARLRGSLTFFEEYQAFDEYLRSSGKAMSSSGGLHAFFDLLSGIAVTELIKYLTGISIPRLAGRFLTVDMLTWDTEIHEVLRVPRLEHNSASRPRTFPWKDFPYGGTQTRRA